MVKKVLVHFLALMLMCGAALADSQGSATGGTAGTQSTGAGCIQQSPTLSSGQQATLSCDASGNLKTYSSGGTAPTPAFVTITDRSRSLSTSSATVAAANASRTTLSLQNLDTAINECYSFTGAAVCGAAGTYTLYPGQTAFWAAGSAPRLAVTAISASGTPVISAYEGQ